MTFRATSPSVWLALAVLAGIVNFVTGGAPFHFAAVNAVALAVALALIHFAPHSGSTNQVTVCAVGAMLALFAPLLVGPDLAGIRRWISLGPLQLHSGMLVLPMLVALLPRLKSNHQCIAGALACVAVSLQPDRASAIALLAGVSALQPVFRSRAGVALILFAACSCVATFLQPDSLQPAHFVENVLIDAARDSVLGAVMLGATLCAALTLPVFGHRWLAPALATIVGFGVASLIGSYPTPLIGYGASSIIGFGLAINVGRAAKTGD